MQHAMRIPNGILHYSTKDAVFNLGGTKVNMEFHHYCGPFFFIRVDNDEKEFPYWYLFPELVEQFNGWWNAKGKKIYANK